MPKKKNKNHKPCLEISMQLSIPVPKFLSKLTTPKKMNAKSIFLALLTGILGNILIVAWQGLVLTGAWNWVLCKHITFVDSISVWEGMGIMLAIKLCFPKHRARTQSPATLPSRSAGTPTIQEVKPSLQ